MIQSYEEAVQYINKAAQGKMIFGLEQIQKLVEGLGNPHQQLRFVHISGTNGKGSTLQFIKSILQCGGYKVGAFTSPYLEKINEQLTIGNEQISDIDFLNEVNNIKPIVDKSKADGMNPTPFEILTAMAFDYFRRNDVDIVLVETGLGGRLDSTNVILPLLSIITNIGHDHMNILGDTTESIAREKAGIIKQGVPVITGVEQPSALDVISEVAGTQDANLFLLNRDFTYSAEGIIEGQDRFTYSSPFSTKTNLQLTLKGEHQLKNASVALMAVEQLVHKGLFTLEEKHIREGLQMASNKARFEVVLEHPTIILDGAHNPEGIQALVDTIQKYYSDKKIHVLFSALGDKSLTEMIHRIETIAHQITFTTFNFPRATTAKAMYDMATISNKDYEESWQEALDKVMNHVNDDEVVVITGSIYFLSELREQLLSK